MFGEEVWLKTEQDERCRLYGCDDPHRNVIVFPDQEPLPDRSLFCRKHAVQIAAHEIHVAGVVGKPK